MRGRTSLFLTLLLSTLGLFAFGCVGDVASSEGDPAPMEEEEEPVDETPNPNAEPPAEGTATIHSVLNGSLLPLEGYEATPIDGRVQMTRYLDGTTQVDLVATGLAPELAYGAHVHMLPCAYQGGGHYKMDPAIEEVLDTNEIWPAFTTNTDGIGRANVVVTHMTRGDAMSVVIHAPEGAKMACADLLADDAGVYTAAGTVAPLPGVELLDETIAGSASMTTTGISTKVDMSLTGLDPASEYVSHVHSLPCGVLEGGPHYMIDPLAVIEDPIAQEANELWPVIGAHELGSATVALTKAHNARYDAQSIVIHRVIAEGELAKVACADLTRGAFPAGETSGSAILLDAGTERLEGLTASAEMTRRLDGTTVVSMRAVGLERDFNYSVHVHTLPCSVSNGGGHYLIDDTATEAAQDNEFWLRLTAGSDSAADATTFAVHTARAEATSLVIHDPADGERLACIDLH